MSTHIGTKVFVGLSGGVDSAVSAALLQKDGYDVTGVFIRIALPGYPCTAGEDKIDAMRVAAHLRIPFFELDLSREYAARVFELSVQEFAIGRTPNPDALCNREIKFGLLYDWCRAQCADFVATGHYAQLKNGRLLAGNDANKDQSYFLWAVPGEKLRRTLFPVGHLAKSEVRALAKKFGLPNAERKDSQGLCFLGPVSVHDMLQRELVLVPGDVRDEGGNIVGRHEGAAAYTLGQRHGYELFAHKSSTPAHYVVAKDVEKNTITVSTERYPVTATETRVRLVDYNFIGAVPAGEYHARYRYRQALIPANLDFNDANQPQVTLLEPHYAPAGQSLVLYDDTRCLGGGTINEVWLSSSPKPTARRSRLTNASL